MIELIDRTAGCWQKISVTIILLMVQVLFTISNVQKTIKCTAQHMHTI